LNAVHHPFFSVTNCNAEMPGYTGNKALRQGSTELGEHSELPVHYVSLVDRSSDLCYIRMHGRPSGWSTSRSKIREIHPFRTLAAMPHRELLIKRESDGRIWPSLTVVLAIQNNRLSPHYGDAGHFQPGAPHTVSGFGFFAALGGLARLLGRS
jgi:hypothetical protein